jgi:Proline-rich nuclear receptor coactivator motif
MEPSHPQNPHHFRQTLNSTHHRSNLNFLYGLTDPSDNDNQSSSLTDGPATPPRTPKPRGAGGNMSDGSAAAAASSKQRRQRTNMRSRDVRTSSSPAPQNGTAIPPLTGPARNTPLTPSKASNTPSKAAYAGPTFHASPAPSALPLPSFFSKSLPHSGNSLQAMLEREGSDKSDASSTRGSPPLPVERQVTEESPLDIFFRADKEEKARARRNNASLSQFDSPGSTIAQLGSPSYLRSPSTPSFNGPPSRDTATPEIFAMDSDSGSSSRKPYGPAFSTPYNERINTIRSNRPPSPNSTVAQSPSPSDEELLKAKTQALKDLLFLPSRHPPVTYPQSGRSRYYSDGDGRDEPSDK